MRQARRLLLLTTLVLAAAQSAPVAAGVRHAREAAPVHPKRGVASARYLAADPAKLATIGATWAYDWSATPPPRGVDLQWVPMVWGPGSVTPAAIDTLTAARRSGRATALLGFNEPDSASQSNMTPAQAAALWPQLERTGLALGSPAPAVPTDGWLARFMALARTRHLRVDFIALHYYQDFTDPNAVSELRSRLSAIHRAYHRPIWITEIGALDTRSWHEPMMRTPTASLAHRYMRAVLAMLDGLPFVTRYAWFTDDCWTDAACRSSSLFTSTGRLTAAGAVFRTAR